MRTKLIWLILGDLCVLALVTYAGFDRHERLEAGLLPMLSTFVPLAVSWGLVGVHVGVFDHLRISEPRQLWRPFWGMFLAAPFAGWLRAMLLDRAVAPIFVLVIAGVGGLALLAWRTLFLFLSNRFLNP